MDIETVRLHCLAKAGTSESFPFDETTLVIKVLDKMFILISLEEDASINVKCDPERAIELRTEYPEAILPGYHMNKQHWNTVKLRAGLSRQLVLEMIDHSYALVVASLPKKKRDSLGD
jgi:predicted DNA-binding protein (MmcQ/YjbR family)